MRIEWWQRREACLNVHTCQLKSRTRCLRIPNLCWHLSLVFTHVFITRDLLSTPMKQVPFDGSFSKLARAAFALRRFAWKRFIRSPAGSIFPGRIFPSDESYFFSLVSSPATGNNDKSSQLFPMTVWINRASKISERERNILPRVL